MHFDKPTRRLLVLSRLLNSRKIFNNEINYLKYSYCTNKFKDETVVTIGDVQKTIVSPKYPEYVPQKYLSEPLSQDTLHHLRWMLQKDKLGQDIFLLGRPGSLKVHLALQYLELTGRELEYVALSRDTTESDLKQRREIQNGTASYVDQSAVRAAVEGRILVLQGIEKAERNVLPVINNLLENREMNLEDGRFLIAASRYDKLLKENGEEQLNKWGLVRVSEDFRVIALGLPVPNYHGNPLDPPLRSRFQARNVSMPTYQDTLEALVAGYPTVPQDKLTKLLSCAFALMSPESHALGLPDFPGDNLHIAAQLMAYFPWYTVRDAVTKLYPIESMLKTEGRKAVDDILSSFDIRDEVNTPKIDSISIGENFTNAFLSCNGKKAAVLIPCGKVTPESFKNIANYVQTEFHERSLTEVLESHLCGDLCILGPRGCGKSTLVNRLAHKLGYTVQPIVLYQFVLLKQARWTNKKRIMRARP